MALGPVACGDDATAEGSDTSTGQTTSEGTTAVDSSGPGTTDDGATSSGSSSSSDTGMVDSSGSGTSTGAETETDTAGFDCSTLPPGPLPFEEVFAAGTVFDGSEDIAFDGQGHLAGKSGAEVRLVSPDGTVVDDWPDPGGTYGLRFRANGELLAAKYANGEIRIVNGAGPLVTMAGGVNGLYPDFDDNVWFTNGSSVRRINPDGSVDAIVTGNPEAASTNGVVLDPTRGLLFYSNYGPGLIRSVVIDGDGSPGVVSMVASIPNAFIDGLSMDACGNLYAMDQGSATLYRVWLDEAGVAVGMPEELAQFPTNVANAVFGRGPGFDEHSLYAAGIPGGVYRVEVGVPGAPYPTP